MLYNMALFTGIASPSIDKGVSTVEPLRGKSRGNT
jgi:hypothetical protein